MTKRTIHKHFSFMTFFSGVFLLILSLTPYILKIDASWGLLLAIFHIIYDLGVVLVADSIIQRYYDYSLVMKIITSKWNLLFYVITTTICGFLLEFFANYLGSYWYFPYWNSYLYLILFIPGFAVYFSAVAFSYWAAKAIFDSRFKGRKLVTKSFFFEKSMYRAFMVIALSGLLFVLIRIGIKTNLGSDFTFNIFAPRKQYIEFVDVFVAFIAIFLGGEYLEYRMKKSSFIRDTLHGYWTPFLAVLVSSTLLALYMEIQNIPLQLWVYINIPFQNIQILGLPVMLFLGWSLHYVAFLSIYRLIGSKLTAEIWAGDKLK